MRAHNFINITGKKYGRLKVIRLDEERMRNTPYRRTYYICKCECGGKVSVDGQKLKTGKTKSCGCLHIDSITKHKGVNTRLYCIWSAMRTRAGKHKNYLHVTVDTRWEDFSQFKKDMERSYISHVKKYGESNTTINRKDNAMGYYKENCEWATYKKQNNNFSRNKYVTYKGKTKTVSQWYDYYNSSSVSKDTFKRRIRVGINPHLAATLPNQTGLKSFKHMRAN